MTNFLSLTIFLTFISHVHAQYSSAPQLTIANPSPQNFQLTWQSKNLRPYFLEGSPDLRTWADASAVVIGNGNSKGITLTNTADKFFYRLREGAIRPGFDQLFLVANDDDTYNYPMAITAVPIGFAVNFYGQIYTTCFVNNNGNITFENSLSTYTPFNLGQLNSKIIAPFWADVDTRGEKSDLVRFSDNSVTSPKIEDRSAFGVTSQNVGYYLTESNKLNSFQVILIDRSDILSGDFDIEFNYNKIQWEAGDRSGGSEGLGGTTTARVGVASGQGQYLEYKGSGETLAFLDSNPQSGLPNHAKGLIYQSLSNSLPGRVLLRFRGGQVQDSFSVNAGVDQVLSEASGAGFQLQGAINPPNSLGVTYLWSQTSGPGNATIVGATTLNPTVKIPIPGDYEFKLTAIKSGDFTVTAQDTVLITHLANYQLNAGFYFATTPASLAVAIDQASVSAPNGVSISLQWTQMSGAPAIINNPTILQPVVTLPRPGTYTFLLTATSNHSVPFVLTREAYVTYNR